MLRDFNLVNYLPILALRPAEMTALEELPAGDKNKLFPLVVLKPWLATNELSKGITRVTEVYGSRPIIVDIEPSAYLSNANTRPVHEQFRQLLSGNDGYEDWISLVEDNANFVPCIQYGAPKSIVGQIERIRSLGRGAVLHLRKEAVANALNLISNNKVALKSLGNSLVVVLNFGQRRRDILLGAAETVGIIQSLQSTLPDAHFAVAATSFPTDFVGLAKQDIYEREFHKQVQLQFGDRRIIYADRGSARDESLNGGGGRIKPRIDIPTATDWRFFREEVGSYQDAAIAAIESDCWDPNLSIWGTQMVRRTKLAEEFAINSPAKSTAARINMHLHRQLFHDSFEGIYDTDEEWQD